MTTASQAPKPAKFNFDTVFGTKGTPAAAASNRTRSAYSAEEVEQIRREAHAAGKQAASAEATHAQAVALSAIAQGTHALIQQYDAQLQTLRAQSAELALVVGRKLAGAALAAAPNEEVLGFISECMHKLHQEPRLVIRVSQATADFIKGQIESLSEQHGFSGRVIVMSDAGMSGAACRIEWADGGVEQDLEATFVAIQEHVARWQKSGSTEENPS
jgi:flagellar assembly protein FliH